MHRSADVDLNGAEMVDDVEVENPPEPGGPLHYLGHVARFSPPRGVGSVRSDSGREISFDVRFLEVFGVGRGRHARDALHEGMRIGFDVGWTSRGLRVTWIRRLDVAPVSEGQAGAEREVAAEEAPDEDGQGGDVE